MRETVSELRRRNVGLLILVLVVAALYLLVVDSVVWAVPGQSPLRQTVPTLTPTPFPEWIWISSPGGDPTDYAPGGVPDVDQKQADWSPTTAMGAWTHSAPVAALNALWWLDSRWDGGTAAPPAIADGWELLKVYGEWDDHDPRNVIPAVEHLALLMGTNARNEDPDYLGTEVNDVLAGLRQYIQDQSVNPSVVVELVDRPSLDQLQGWARAGDATVLMLGFWQWQGEAWAYLGGHYVTLAGFEPYNRLVALSDPYRDAYEEGRSLLGRIPFTHSYPHDVDVHNDVRYVSHDSYHSAAVEGPGGTLALTDYVDFWAAFEEITNHMGQNVPVAFQQYLGRYSSAAVTPKVDYAIVLKRDLGPQVYQVRLPIILKGSW